MIQSEISLHAEGASIFLDDIVTPAQTLYAYPVKAPAAHGKITHTNIYELIGQRGVIDILTYRDIPGHNLIGHIIPDEPLLAPDYFEYIGQSVALVIAESQNLAIKIARSIQFKFESLPAVFDPRQAYSQNKIIGKERIFCCGEIEGIWKQCDHIFCGRAETGAQEHLYMEPQGALAIPYENRKLKVFSSTQAPTAVQRTISEVLAIPMNLIEVDVARIGGGFGGKEDQANQFAALAALAANKLRRPVKLIMSRSDDMQITGKRHPYSVDFKIGLSDDLHILGYEATFFQNAGAYADLSPAILERTMFHITNSYYIPNVKARGISCKTNLPPNTAFRGFGGPQAMFAIESAIYQAAHELQVAPVEIQKRNLIENGQTFPYGMTACNNNARRCWDTAFDAFQFSSKKYSVSKFNSENEYFKKGLALMPVCFGISFTSTFLNQASALVHVYTDGSVAISTGAVEMGQGVNEKIRTVAARLLSINMNKIHLNSTNTTRNANTSPTAASTGADLNGNAVKIACQEILHRLKLFLMKHFNAPDEASIEIKDEAVYHKGKLTEIRWQNLIDMAYKERINLSSHAFYATPDIYFNRETSKGNPFAYHVTGTAIIQVTLDIQRGTFEIDSIEAIHDAGKSLDRAIDMGQLEGGIMQGIGWMTMEDIQYSPTGKLLSDTFSTYKVPDIFSVPENFDIRFLEDTDNNLGVLGAKAIGEPPFMYGIAVYFALLQAMQALRNDLKPYYNAPMTNEKILLSLYQ